MNDNTPPIGAHDDTARSLCSEKKATPKGGHINPEKTSYEAQRLRDGDEFFIYAGQADTWEVPWGTK
ncbi:hypothetical protein [Agrobacterium tumefaciens]|uniref:hypothetical protein n=1 Tax=Agrobacterium tumefaciens TaxID=358 RepID=UPI00045A1E76|nr:hypothetical protein [Agrobacterium tumefaciens]CDN92516.1 hypothetical protein BN949_01661 [Agrobacterium tumefaciens]